VLLERSESSTTAAPNAENDYANGPSSSDLFVARLHRHERGMANLCRCALVSSTAAVEVVMATYRIELTQSVVETCIVFVEATDAQAAEDLVLSGVMAAGLSPTALIAEWKLKDIIGDIEVIGVKELKP
jgi:hypothetical protein